MTGMEIELLGGAGTVTGSKTVVREGNTQLLVDCGLFQGLKHLRARNWDPLPLEVGALDAVVLTHAHLDHSGYVPALVRQGYRGPVYASRETIALCAVLWPDSGRLQEEDASHAERHGYSKHRSPRPLYTETEAIHALDQLRAVDMGTPHAVGELTVELAPAGHILGASMVRVSGRSSSVLFSGDLGRPDDLVMLPPETSLTADLLVLESTYGDRRHRPVDGVEALGKVVNRTVHRGGTVLIPAFAIGRTQALLLALQRLRATGAIPDIPVFLDSPMAIAATETYVSSARGQRLSDADLAVLADSAQMLQTVAESKSLSRRTDPCVIVSAAGMLTGGRVLHHFARLAPDPRNTIVIVGYQAAGTRGASLLAGERRIKVHGRYVPVRARVESIDAFSAHADQQELMDWVSALPSAPSSVLLNHGEPSASESLRRRVVDELGLPCEVAQDRQRVRVPLADHRAGPGPTPAVIAESTDDEGGRLERILASGSYVRADQDLALLASAELRPSRLMLEYLKVDLALRHHGIEALVAVFGSARTDDPGQLSHRGATTSERWGRYYDEARALGALIGTESYDGTHRALLVTGGGPGVMEAASRGAFETGARAVGFNIALEHEQAPNSYLTPELTFQFRYFGIRKLHFLGRAVALVAFPGGFGTLDELYETLALLQTGRMKPIPVVLVGRDYWQRTYPLDFLVSEGFLEPHDADLVTIVDTGKQAWQAIRRFYLDHPRPVPDGPLEEGSNDLDRLVDEVTRSDGEAVTADPGATR